MTIFLENIKNWHKEITFASFRISTVHSEMSHLAETMPAAAILFKLLNNIPKSQLKEAEKYPSSFWPGNIVGVLEDMGIDTADKFDKILGGKTCNFLVAHLIQSEYKIDKKSLPLITRNEIEAAIKEQCFVNNIKFFFGDAQYWLCPQDTIKEVLKLNLINKEPYSYVFVGDNKTEKMVHDCDNFAMELSGRFSKSDLSGLAFGQCWLEAIDQANKDKVYFGHAINLFVDTYKKIHLVEPQTDQIFEPKMLHHMMGADLAYRLFFTMMV